MPQLSQQTTVPQKRNNVSPKLEHKQEEMSMKESQEPLLPTAVVSRQKSNHRNWMIFTILLVLLIGLGGVYSTFGDSKQPSLDQQQPSTSSGDLKMDEQLTTLGQEWTSLRQRKGHWDGGDFDPLLDGFTGRKFQVMKELGLLLSTKASSASTVLQILGKPDEMSESNDIQSTGISDASEAGSTSIQGMPGPVILGGGEEGLSEESAGKPYYLIYHWRGRHDYLWFKVQGPQEQITASGWYHAGE